MKRILIVVDMQNDFCLESGSLYVKGATPALWSVEDFIYNQKLDEVWFTADWHQPKHPSFKENGGPWPVHCVQFSQGAAINDLLLTACRNKDIPYKVYTKGWDVEEYGAFRDIGKFGAEGSFYTYYNGCTYCGVTIEEDSEFVICGVAGDYCVLNTIKNLKLIWDRLSVYLPGIASIDGGQTLQNFIEENNLKLYEP